MLNEPVFLTDANHDVILEVICGSPNAALPDCCKPFDRMIPGTTDGASEKHVPIIETSGLHVTVKVGEILHPMSCLLYTSSCYCHHSSHKNCQ